MCNAERKKRGFTMDERCTRCGAEKEDIEHTLRNCPAAAAVWRSINVEENTGTSSSINFDVWLQSNLTGNPGGQKIKQRSARFAITIWWIWKWRNDFIFNGLEREVKDKTEWLRRQFKEIEEVLEKTTGPLGRQRRDERRNRPWKPPEAGWIKLNTDGCVGKDRHATSGGIFRNAEASFLGAVTRHIGICSPLEAELWGIYTGLQKAWERGYYKIELETDCANAIKIVQGRDVNDGPARNLVELCREMLNKRWEVKLSHIPREQNKVADAMAKNSSDQTVIVK